MADEAMRKLLIEVAEGKLSTDDAMRRLAQLPFEDLGFAKVDHHRSLRCGFPEVIFCPNKTPEQVVAIARSIHNRGSHILASRVGQEAAAALVAEFPTARHNVAGRTVVIAGQCKVEKLPGRVAIVCAGTSDLPVAEEARETAEILGCTTDALYDVGVAGIHRLLAHGPTLREASAIIVIAGMEGALASVVGGLVDVPIIAVPTSVGYGAHLGGLAPLLTMLNSCAGGVSVVNIDNGFGAAYAAALICRSAAKLIAKGDE